MKGKISVLKTLALDAGKVIRAMRHAAKLDQKTLAKTLGITPSVLSRLENGTQKVPLAALLCVAKLCGFQLQAAPVAVDADGPIPLKSPD